MQTTSSTQTPAAPAPPETPIPNRQEELLPYRQGSALLMGGPGSGKTHSLASLVKAGLKLAVVFTEPSGPESLLAGLKHYNCSAENVHWHYVPPANPSWNDMIQAAKTIGGMSYESLSQMKQMGSKSGYQQYLDLLNQLANFQCERTGKSLGPVDALDSSWAFALDGLSGLNLMSMDLVAGGKPTKHQGEWGVAMDVEEKLINKLSFSTSAYFILVSHIEREMNELTGGYMTTVSALGRKLAPKIPRFFSDVVHAYREGDQFYWSTTTAGFDLKYRMLPLKDKMPSSFVPAIEEWNRRMAQAQPGA